MTRPALLFFALFALAPPVRVRAQVVPTVDVGVSSLGYSGTVRSTALSITPAIRMESDYALFGSSATFSQFDGGDWSAQAAAGASVFTPAWRGLRAEVAATGSAIAHRTLFRAGDGILRVRGHAHGAGMGAWIGGGMGWAHHADSWNPLALVEIGGWSQHGGLRLGASVTSRAVAVVDSFLTAESELARYHRVGTHVDGLLTLGWSGSRLDLELVAGLRDGGSLASSARWGSVSASYRLTDWLQVIAEGGGEPEIVAQRLPQGRYGVVAFRFAPQGRRRPPTRTIAPLTADFVLDGEDGAERTVRLRVPDARQVELRSDFTDWEPVDLRRALDGSWMITLPIPRGTHRVSIRVDGGEWQPPPGLPATVDELGGLVGLIVVR